MNNCGIVLTGRPGVGKTTLILSAVSGLDRKAGGMVTSEIRKCGHRVGFSVTDLATGHAGVLAHIHQTDGRQIGRYRVCLADLNAVGIAAIRNAVADPTIALVVIDEIAPMELVSPDFVPAVEQALACGKPLLISTHAHTDHPLVHDIRRRLDLVRVKLSNRDDLADTLAHKLASLLRAPPIDGERQA
ncbi:NTPase [Candidatus Bipolaricaulota bacterium]|nr:NTPase [Candidatus Bipolaricaulota bacterium]